MMTLEALKVGLIEVLIDSYCFLLGWRLRESGKLLDELLPRSMWQVVAWSSLIVCAGVTIFLAASHAGLGMLVLACALDLVCLVAVASASQSSARGFDTQTERPLQKRRRPF